MHQLHLKLKITGQLYSRLLMALALSLMSFTVIPTSTHADEAADTSSAAANWITYRGDAQRTGYRDETLGGIPNLVWRYTSTDDAQPLYSSPLVMGVPGQRRVYFAAGDKVYCIDGETGVTQWITPSLTSTIASPLLLQSTDDGDILYCITTVGNMLAIDPVRGKTIKSLPLQATVQNVAPVPVKTVNGTRLIVGTIAGKLIAIDPQSMKIDPSWDISLGRFGAAVTSTPALTVDGKYLYVPAQDGNIYVVDVAKGKIYYPIQMRYGIIGSPAIAGDNVIVANGPLITCLNGNNGKTRWALSLDTLTQTSPAVTLNADGSGVVYAGTSSGKFYAINLQTGKQLWQQNLGDTVTATPTALNDMVLAGTQRGMLFGMDPQKGDIKWQYRVNTERKLSISSRYSNASTTDRSGYNADDDTDTRSNSNARTPSTNILNRFRNRNRFGEDITIYPLSTAPTVVDGKIFVGGDNLTIYAFDAQPFDASPPLLQGMKTFVKNSANDLQDVSDSRSIPGKPPVVLKGKLEDTGSGVDPSSIKVLLNGQVLPDTFHTFNPLSGELEIYLTGTEEQADTPLKDGRITVEVQAADYMGNKASGQNNTITLRVDNNQAAPEPTNTTSRNRGSFRRR